MLPHMGRGKPRNVWENIAEICTRLGVVLRYNVITKEEELLIPGEDFSLDNRQNASIAWLESECGKFEMPTSKLGGFVTYIADKNLYNPVTTWVLSKKWDEIDRLGDFFKTVTAREEAENEQACAMKCTFIKRWMISAIAAAFRPNGVSAHGVLVFQGAQYIGKTKWFKNLAPDSLGIVQDGVTLQPGDRDSMNQCVRNWLVELGELDATFKKSDIAQLKAFLTKDKDTFRRAYARKESEYARRTVFFASVNQKEFLHDPTGNRRYWTIEVESLNYDHGLDMQQCWAQVYELYKAGEGWYLLPEEMAWLNESNADFEVIDPIAELIQTGLVWGDPPHAWRWVPVSDVLRELGIDRPTISESTKAAHVIRTLNGKRSKKTGGIRLIACPNRRWVP